MTEQVNTTPQVFHSDPSLFPYQNDTLYGPHSTSQDLLSSLHTFGDFEQDEQDELNEILQDWGTSTSKTWEELLEEADAAGVDLGSLAPANNTPWCDITAFNAIARESQEPKLYLESDMPRPILIPDLHTAPHANQPVSSAPPPSSSCLPSDSTAQNSVLPHHNGGSPNVPGRPTPAPIQLLSAYQPIPAQPQTKPSPSTDSQPNHQPSTNLPQPPQSKPRAELAREPTAFMLSMNSGFGKSLFGHAVPPQKGPVKKPIHPRKKVPQSSDKENLLPSQPQMSTPISTTTAPPTLPSALSQKSLRHYNAGRSAKAGIHLMRPDEEGHKYRMLALVPYGRGLLPDGVGLATLYGLTGMWASRQKGGCSERPHEARRTL
ncbi:hypothetical protein NMY22_g4279 [Coprinellus aureogranulatus]|nr:hypothetical protein NMY22_g4279 [Coprinellus aureogranulatus]